MSVRTYALTSSIIFFVVVALQLLRLVMQWDVVIGDWHMPMWASLVAVLVAGFMSFTGFRLFKAQRISLFG